MAPELRTESISALLIVDALKDAFRWERPDEQRPARKPLGWVLAVPDTHQRSVLRLLGDDPDIRLVTCSTEDEANAIAAGLYMGGEPVMMQIQHAGLYASVNTLRGVAMDGRVPSFYLIGLLGRKPGEELADSRSSMVRYAEPLLDTFGIPHARLEHAGDLPRIAEYYRLSREQRGPAAVLVGLETAE
jgi:sulfopyruvate decarboxylase TPP-binding subunit